MVEKMLNENEEVAVVFISDSNYAAVTAVAITSIYENRKKSFTYHIYLISIGIPCELIDASLRLTDTNFKISIIPYSSPYKEFEKRDFHVSTAAIVKFELPNILYNIDKVLYLDGDIIVKKDLHEFFEINIDDLFAGVVKDAKAVYGTKIGILNKLGSRHEYYFNSGVMLLNLAEMRRKKISEKLFDYRRNGLNFFMDQDALNIVFEEKVKYLPLTYNYMITIDGSLQDDILKKEYGIDTSQTAYQRMEDAIILHLTSEEKPWNTYISYATEQFMHYYRKSPIKELVKFEPKPKKEIEEQYLFPFELVERESRIIIYGAGNVGACFFKQIKHSKYCNIVMWADRCYADYKDMEMEVNSPESMLEQDFDYVVIAVKNERAANEIKEEWIQKGIDKKKIKWSYPVLK